MVFEVEAPWHDSARRREPTARIRHQDSLAVRYTSAGRHQTTV
jgi:hypothetical protein